MFEMRLIVLQGFIQLGTFVITLFFLPETLYHRDYVSAEEANHYQERTILDIFLFRRQKGKAKLTISDFMKPLYMLRYIAVLLPGLYYMTAFGYGTLIYSMTGAQVFAEFYHFDVAQTGMILSIPLLTGCLIGELNAGWVTDWLVRRYAKRNDGHIKPEARLNLMWGGLLVPIGLILDGVFLSHYKVVSWVGPAFAMGITSLGFQITTTVMYAYTTDVSDSIGTFNVSQLSDRFSFSVISLKVPRSLRFSMSSAKYLGHWSVSTRKSLIDSYA
jgi:hypothetical protein